MSYSTIAEPLNRLLRKDTKFKWSDDCERAFQALKRALTSAPILAYPDFTKEMILYTDASTTGIGAILSQNHDGHERVIYSIR